MKQPAIEWLLDSKDPSIRFHTLTDLLGRRASDKDVVAAQKKIGNYGPVRNIMKAQTRGGYWPPKETCYRPKWTAAAWPLALLGEMAAPVNDRIKGECERFFNLHQVDSGAFACPSKIEKKGKRWDEPCLTGQHDPNVNQIWLRRGSPSQKGDRLAA